MLRENVEQAVKMIEREEQQVQTQEKPRARTPQDDHDTNNAGNCRPGRLSQPGQQFPSTMPLIDILLPEYDREIATTRAVIDAAHELDLSWRPDARARTLGELVTHLADIAAWTSIVMTREGYDVTDRPDTRQSRALATVLERFDTSASAGRMALAGRIDGELTLDWTLTRRGHLIFTLPRVSVIRVLVLNHLIHHRGQLSVYLRMRGARVPSIYGPTADG